MNRTFRSLVLQTAMRGYEQELSAKSGDTQRNHVAAF